MSRLILSRWAFERLRALEDLHGVRLQAETEVIEHADKPAVEELYGLRVTGRTSWGLSDTIVLRGPAAVDEEGNPTGPDEIEVKISSPTRMDLGSWFKDEVRYTLEFGPEDAQDAKVATGPGSIVFPCMEVVEKTPWGLSTTCRLQTETSRGKYAEVKVTIPWPEDRFLKEGEVFNVVFEPVKEKDEFTEPPDPEPREDEQPYREQGGAEEETLKDRVREAVRRAREYDHLFRCCQQIQDAINAWEVAPCR